MRNCVDDERLRLDSLSSPSANMKQSRLDLDSAVPVTQKLLDGYVLDYIVDSVLALHHVDLAPFVKYTSRLTGGRLVPCCRQTLANQLHERFDARIKELKKMLENISLVCTTADCWSCRRRSFLGITIHWLDPQTLSRKGCCLALRQLSGRHTYDSLAKVLQSVNTLFGIDKKICFTVTDSGANFLKAFKHFSLEEAEEPAMPADRADEGEDEDDVDMNFEEINELLVPPPSAVNGQAALYKLPPHRKCACHLLNLIASKDAENITGVTKTTSTQTFAKLQGLWNKQNRSTTAAETIKNSLGSLLITPGSTRWNSMYDSVVKIDSILRDQNLADKFDSLCDDLIGTRLLPAHRNFVEEYVQVMAPLACVGCVARGEEYGPGLPATNPYCCQGSAAGVGELGKTCTATDLSAISVCTFAGP